jgi:flagellar FliL protein
MQPRNRAGRSLLILLLGCGLASLGLGVGAGLFVAHRAHASSAHGRGQKKKEKKPIEVGSVYSVGEIVVNLADTSTMRYAKVSVAIGFVEKVPEDQFKEQMPVLRDIVISVLTRKTFDQLHHRGGIDRLKKEILTATALRFHAATVAEVYLEAFAMQ